MFVTLYFTTQIPLNYSRLVCAVDYIPHLLQREKGRRVGVGWGEALSQSCPMVFLKLAMGAGGSLPVLTGGGACACHCLLFHYYLHSPAAFTTLVSLCGHIETERETQRTHSKAQTITDRGFFFHAFSPLGTRICLLLLTCTISCKATSSGYGWLSAKFPTLSKVGTFEPACDFCS